jgi:hypothetical protein
MRWLALGQATPFWLPGLWLLFYGAAVFAGGIVSLREVRYLGAMLFVTGVVSCLFPFPAWLSTLVGFGALHVIFGGVIWRNHGA